MKKSIAFLGALLFGSVTFGQVTKNDSIKKPSSRKVSSDDMKNFPADAESTTTIGGIKGETLEKHKGEQRDFQKMTIKHATLEKHASDASAGADSEIKGTVTQKGKGKDGIIITEKMSGGNAMTTEKQHYTIKLTNANKKTNPDASEQTDNGDGEAAIQKKHVSNIKWTPGKATVGKTVKDSLPTPNAKSTDMFLKIGDIKGEKEGVVSPPTSTKSTDMFLKIGDIKGEK